MTLELDREGRCQATTHHHDVIVNVGALPKSSSGRRSKSFVISKLVYTYTKLLSRYKRLRSIAARVTKTRADRSVFLPVIAAAAKVVAFPLIGVFLYTFNEFMLHVAFYR